jgi:hypothetical protein
MTIDELIERLHDYDGSLTVYAETDSEVGPVHGLDRDQFNEDGTLVEALVLIATEPDAPGGPPVGIQVRPASPPQVQP